MKEIFKFAEGFDTRKVTNRSIKVLHTKYVDALEAGEIDYQFVVDLAKEFPVYQYRSCITIHGDIPLISTSGVGGYKNIIQNANGSVEVLWSAIDMLNKLKLAEYYRSDYHKYNLRVKAVAHSFNLSSTAYTHSLYYSRTAESVALARLLITTVKEYLVGTFSIYDDGQSIVLGINILAFKDFAWYIYHTIGISASDIPLIDKEVNASRLSAELLQRDRSERDARLRADEEKAKAIIEPIKAKLMEATYKRLRSVGHIQKYVVKKGEILVRPFALVGLSRDFEVTTTVVYYRYYLMNINKKIPHNGTTVKGVLSFKSETLHSLNKVKSMFETLQVADTDTKEYDQLLEGNFNPALSKWFNMAGITQPTTIYLPKSGTKTPTTTRKPSEALKSGSNEITVYDYSDKTVAVVGDGTYAIKDELKTKFGAFFNKWLKIEGVTKAGWLVQVARKQELLNYIETVK